LKDKEDCIVRIVLHDGKFSLTWQMSHLIKPNYDSAVLFDDVDNVEEFIYPATLTTSRQLLIKIESKQKSIILETTNESQHQRWFELCQAAYVVSHTLRKRLEIKNREQFEEEEAKDRVEFQERRRTWADTRTAMAEKYSKRRYQSSS
jgi:hypothetical protein